MVMIYARLASVEKEEERQKQMQTSRRGRRKYPVSQTEQN